MLPAVGVGHEDLDVLADEFLFAVAEDPQGGGVERLDRAAFVDGDDAIDSGDDDRPQAGLAQAQILLDALAFGGAGLIGKGRSTLRGMHGAARGPFSASGGQFGLQRGHSESQAGEFIHFHSVTHRAEP